jgi:hypothetical protein
VCKEFDNYLDEKGVCTDTDDPIPGCVNYMLNKEKKTVVCAACLNPYLNTDDFTDCVKSYSEKIRGSYSKIKIGNEIRLLP